MTKWHNLESYGFFKDVRQSFEAMSDESAGAVIKALFALDDGESVDLSGKSETVKSVLPTLAQSMMRCQLLRAKNGKKLIVTPEKIVLDVVSGVVSWVVPEVVSAVSEDIEGGTPIPKPEPEPLPSPDKYFCIQTDESEKSAPFIPEKIGVFADEIVRQKWLHHVSVVRPANRWSLRPGRLKEIAQQLESVSGGDARTAEESLNLAIEHPYGSVFKVIPKNAADQTEKPFGDVPEEWDQIGGGQ